MLNCDIQKNHEIYYLGQGPLAIPQNIISDHFVEVNKMVKIGLGTEREV